MLHSLSFTHIHIDIHHTFINTFDTNLSHCAAKLLCWLMLNTANLSCCILMPVWVVLGPYSEAGGLSSVFQMDNHGLLDPAVAQIWDLCWEKRPVWEWGMVYSTGKGLLETKNPPRSSISWSSHQSVERHLLSWYMTRLATWGENAPCLCCVLSVSGPGWLLMLLPIYKTAIGVCVVSIL